MVSLALARSTPVLRQFSVLRRSYDSVTFVPQNVKSIEVAPQSSILTAPKSFSNAQFQQAFRCLQTSAPRLYIDSAAKFTGIGATTVGFAGSGADNAVPWSWLMEEFEETLSSGDHLESDFCSNYIYLLKHFFPLENYRTDIQPLHQSVAYPEAGRSPGGASVRLIVRSARTRHVMLLFDVRSEADYQWDIARKVADEEIRERLAGMIACRRVPRVYGISALGPRLAFYVGHTVKGGIITPPVQLDCPRSLWNTLVTSPVAHKCFMEVAQDIHQMCLV